MAYVGFGCVSHALVKVLNSVGLVLRVHEQLGTKGLCFGLLLALYSSVLRVVLDELFIGELILGSLQQPLRRLGCMPCLGSCEVGQYPEWYNPHAISSSRTSDLQAIAVP